MLEVSNHSYQAGSKINIRTLKPKAEQQQQSISYKPPLQFFIALKACLRQPDTVHGIRLKTHTK